MTRDQRSTGEARDELFGHFADIRAGMLGIDGAGRMRPMTHFVDEDAGVIRFVTSRKAELASEVGQGATGHYCLVGDGFYATVAGTVSPSEDAATLDELWNPVAAVWFTGRDDPDILLLSMPIREAEIWSSTDSTLHFGIEIARANLDRDREPDVGTHDKIRF